MSKSCTDVRTTAAGFFVTLMSRLKAPAAGGRQEQYSSLSAHMTKGKKADADAADTKRQAKTAHNAKAATRIEEPEKEEEEFKATSHPAARAKASCEEVS